MAASSSNTTPITTNPLSVCCLGSDNVLSQTPRYLCLEITACLNPKEISRLGLTERFWRNVTEDPILWNELLKRHFGDRAANDEALINPKLTYIEKYINLTNFISQNIPGGPALLSDSKKDLSPKLFGGVISLESMSSCIRSLSPVELKEVFIRSACEGITIITKAIMDSPRFSEIEPNGEQGLGKAIFHLAQSGYTEGLSLIMSNPKFDQIDATGRNSLGDAFVISSYSNEPNALKLLMNNPRFNEFALDHCYGLGAALCNVSKNGDQEKLMRLMSLILNNPRSDEIDPNEGVGLGQALKIIAECSSKAIQLIVNHKNFSKINPNGENGLGVALAAATNWGNDSANKIRLIATHPRYNEIEANGPLGLGAILCSALVYCDEETIKLIMEHPRFKEVSKEGDFGLKKARLVAENYKNLVALSLIDKCL